MTWVNFSGKPFSGTIVPSSLPHLNPALSRLKTRFGSRYHQPLPVPEDLTLAQVKNISITTFLYPLVTQYFRDSQISLAPVTVTPNEQMVQAFRGYVIHHLRNTPEIKALSHGDIQSHGQKDMIGESPDIIYKDPHREIRLPESINIYTFRQVVTKIRKEGPAQGPSPLGTLYSDLFSLMNLENQLTAIMMDLVKKGQTFQDTLPTGTEMAQRYGNSIPLWAIVYRNLKAAGMVQPIQQKQLHGASKRYRIVQTTPSEVSSSASAILANDRPRAGWDDFLKACVADIYRSVPGSRMRSPSEIFVAMKQRLGCEVPQRTNVTFPFG